MLYAIARIDLLYSVFNILLVIRFVSLDMFCYSTDVDMISFYINSRQCGVEIDKASAVRDYRMLQISKNKCL